MERPPRPRTARLLDRAVLGRAFGFLGPVEAVAVAGAAPARSRGCSSAGRGNHCRPAVSPRRSCRRWSSPRSSLMQMANAFECRSNPASLFSIGPFSNRLLVGAVAVEAVALLGFVYLPPIQSAARAGAARTHPVGAGPRHSVDLPRGGGAEKGGRSRTPRSGGRRGGNGRGWLLGLASPRDDCAS